MTAKRKEHQYLFSRSKMNILQIFALASFILINFLVEKSETLKEHEKIEIPALFDYETGLVFYKDDTIPACFVENFSGIGLDSSGLLRIPMSHTKNYTTPSLETFSSYLSLSHAGFLFCRYLPIINMDIKAYALPTVEPHHPLKLSKRRVMRGKVRRKRQTSGYYRNGPVGEARAQGNWNFPGQASQAQVQGQVFGTGIFSGQAQTQSGGMSQSQVQLSGVGVRGQIASSSGNAQAQLSLGNGVGSGQASGLGAGPSNSQVQVTLGQGNEESMASASATSGGARAGIQDFGGGAPFSNGGGYYSSTGGGMTTGVTNGGGYTNGNGYVPGYTQGSPISTNIYRGQHSNGGANQLTQDRMYFPQQTSHFGNIGSQTGSPTHLQSPVSGTQMFHGTGIGSLTNHTGGLTGANGHRKIQQDGQGDTGTNFRTNPAIQGVSNGVRYDASRGDTSGGRHFNGGASGNQGPIGPQSGLSTASGSRGQSRVVDFDNTSSGGTRNGYRDQSSITASRGSPSNRIIEGKDAPRGFRIANSGSRDTSATYSPGLGTEGYPYTQSITPGAYATSHGIGQTQAQTTYFGNAEDGQYAPHRYFQESQPAKGQTNTDSVQKYQDQQAGYGRADLNQPTGGKVSSPTSSQNGYRVSTQGRNGNGFPSIYSSNRNNGFQYTNGARNTGQETVSTLLSQTHRPTVGVERATSPSLGSPSIAGRLDVDSHLQGAGSTVSTDRGSSRSPSTGYIPVSDISSQHNGQRHGVRSPIGGRQTDYYPYHSTSPRPSISTTNQQVPGPVRNGQPYRINGLGQIIPAGHSRHPVSPTTTTITGGSSGVDIDASHTSTLDGQSGFFPSYGVSRASPDDPEGNKCTIITFSCTIVVESNGRAKICKPNAVRVNNGGNGYNNVGGVGNSGSKICCC